VEGEMSDPAVGEAGSREGKGAPAPDRHSLVEQFAGVRDFTVSLCEPLALEDYVLQNMADVSPTRWHLAHTTWFFERFILQETIPDYEPRDSRFFFLFNSYYHTLGEMHSRPDRGQLSRPTVEEIRAYRREIDRRLCDFIAKCGEATLAQIEPVVELGCHHEQQHQELLLTDIKYNLSCNPLLPAYREDSKSASAAAPAKREWTAFEGGIREIGHAGPGFSFDNEGPRHEVLLRPYALASRLVTNGEFLAFLEDGGYERHELWLDMGYARIREEGWSHPLYWYQRDGAWMQYTLGGPVRLEEAEPVCHVDFFEADAFARWAGHRLPTEAEWEVAAVDQPLEGNLAETGRFHVEAGASGSGGELSQIYGDVWEWTASPYSGYPGYRPPPGAIGEYNGKFMCNQYVLRGGSCATPRSHLRTTYRNFFPPKARWQFTGIRLARDA
jgi:ergothioneine biosynthesis protein EgtB